VKLPPSLAFAGKLQEGFYVSLGHSFPVTHSYHANAAETHCTIWLAGPCFPDPDAPGRSSRPYRALIGTLEAAQGVDELPLQGSAVAAEKAQSLCIAVSNPALVIHYQHCLDQGVQGLRP
jgi:hypothetical protein